MKPEQLTLEFSFNSDKDLEIIPDEISSFLRWTGNDLPGTKVKRPTKAPDPKKLELVVAQRKRSYHTSYDSSYFVRAFQPFFTHFREKTKDFATTKTVPVSQGVRRNGIPADSPVAHNSIWHPGKMSMDIKDDSAVVDMGWAIYYRDPEKSNEIRGLPYARLWIHVEYHSGKNGKKKGISAVDLKKSYVGFTHNRTHAGVFVARFNEIQEIKASYSMLMPWTISLKLNSQLPKYFVEHRDQISKSINNSIVLSNMGPGLQKLIFQFVANRGSGFYSARQHSEDLLAMALSDAEPNDYIGYFSGAEIKELSGGKYPKMYAKHLAQTASWFLEDGPKEISTNDTQEVRSKVTRISTNRRSETVDQWIDRVQSLYSSLYKLMEFYETPNVLNLFDPKEIYEGTYIDRNRYYNGYNRSDSLIALAKNEWFSGFPLPKQWRLLKEGLIGPDAMILTDSVSMLVKIEANEVELDEHISRRDIKTIKNLHDELVKVYNTIRYKPVPIKPEFTEWIREYGTKVGEDFEFVFPEDTNTIRNWGQTQGHCIGSYADRASTGATILLGVMDLKTKDWLGHMQISPPSSTLKKHSISRDKIEDRNRGGRGYGHQSICGPAGISIQQFYGKRNSAVPQDKKDPVVNHLKEAALAYFFKPEDKEEN